MPNALDLRTLRIGVEVNGEVRYYDDLYIEAQCSKYMSSLQNEGRVKIVNLKKDIRDFILTETTPFNFNRSPKELIIEAGRASYGYSQVFRGTIIRAFPSQPPDIALTICARSNQFEKGNIISRSQGARIPLSQLAANIAKDINCILVFEATDKQIANYSFTGAALSQVVKLGNMGRVNAYVDDNKLIVKNVNVPLSQTSHVLSEETGMVGIPEPTEHGVRVKYLYDPTSQLGGAMKLESKLNPVLNGNFIVYQLDFDLANRDQSFYCIAEAQREGYIW